jgi:hypothetical protein
MRHDAGIPQAVPLAALPIGPAGQRQNWPDPHFSLSLSFFSPHPHARDLPPWSRPPCRRRVPPSRPTPAASATSTQRGSSSLGPSTGSPPARRHSAPERNAAANPSPGFRLSRRCEEAVEPWMREVATYSASRGPAAATSKGSKSASSKGSSRPAVAAAMAGGGGEQARGCVYGAEQRRWWYK